MRHLYPGIHPAPLNPIIPTEFSDNFSYYEDIRVLIHKVKKLKEFMNIKFCELWEEYTTHEDRIVKRLKEYVDTQDKSYSILLKTEIEKTKTDFISKLNSLKTELSTNIENLRLDFTEENAKIYEKYDNYMDSVLSEIRTWMESFTPLTENLSERISNLETDFNERWDRITYLVTQIMNAQINFNVNTKENLFREMTEKFMEIERKIVENTGDTFTVFNPVTGKFDTLNNSLFDLYEIRTNNIWVFTAEEFDNSGITADMFDKRSGGVIEGFDPLYRFPLTCRGFDDYGKLFFFEHLWSPRWMDWIKKLENRVENLEKYVEEHGSGRNPVTGEMTDYYNMILSLADLHRKSLTCEEFDNLQYSATYLDERGFSAFLFDFESRALAGMVSKSG